MTHAERFSRGQAWLAWYMGQLARSSDFLGVGAELRGLYCELARGELELAEVKEQLAECWGSGRLPVPVERDLAGRALGGGESAAHRMRDREGMARLRAGQAHGGDRRALHPVRRGANVSRAGARCGRGLGGRGASEAARGHQRARGVRMTSLLTAVARRVSKGDVCWGKTVQPCADGRQAPTFNHSSASLHPEVHCRGWGDGGNWLARLGRRGGELQRCSSTRRGPVGGGGDASVSSLRPLSRQAFAGGESDLGSGGAVVSAFTSERGDGDCQVPSRWSCLSQRGGAAGPEWRRAPYASSLTLIQRLGQLPLSVFLYLRADCRGAEGAKTSVRVCRSGRKPAPPFTCETPRRQRANEPLARLSCRGGL